MARAGGGRPQRYPRLAPPTTAPPGTTPTAPTTTVYVLQCEGGRYYVGKTARPLGDRVEEHFQHKGGAWTRLHAPLRVVEAVASDDDMAEDRYTKLYMRRHGVDCVRGGSYAAVVLPDYKLRALRDEICTAEGRCFRCQRTGHFHHDCPGDAGRVVEEVAGAVTSTGGASTRSGGAWRRRTVVGSGSGSSSGGGGGGVSRGAEAGSASGVAAARRGFRTSAATGARNNYARRAVARGRYGSHQNSAELNCARCGLSGHTAEECEEVALHMQTAAAVAAAAGSTTYRARVQYWDSYDSDSDSEDTVTCRRCRRGGHVAAHCYAKTTLWGQFIGDHLKGAQFWPDDDDDSESGSDFEDGQCCFRCGRPGHFVADCYAKTNADGTYIHQQRSTARAHGATRSQRASAWIHSSRDRGGLARARVGGVQVGTAYRDFPSPWHLHVGGIGM